MSSYLEQALRQLAERQQELRRSSAPEDADGAGDDAALPDGADLPEPASLPGSSTPPTRFTSSRGPAPEPSAAGGGPDEPPRPGRSVESIDRPAPAARLGAGAAGAVARTKILFSPSRTKTLRDTGLEQSFIEELALKALFNQPGLQGLQVARLLGLPRDPISAILEGLRQRKLVVYRGSTATGDFNYELSSAGRQLARELRQTSYYVGPAPVPLEHYIDSVQRQSIGREHPTLSDLQAAFSDLLVAPALLERLGPALSSGRGLFLYGAPGNGKTSLAERITASLGTSVYIPYAIYIDGHIIKVFDPQVHERLDEPNPKNVDPRWVRCRRPTVIVGGELTLGSLEISYNPMSGICEAPVQVKANCGTLVIDDFGRQRVHPTELLNRWIVPLENRIDYLSLPDGRKIKMPFDPFLIFATNLDPGALVDEAFLRRIPYKIQVHDPTEQAFFQLLRFQSRRLGFAPDDEIFNYLIDTWYRPYSRPYRCCHPRDLLQQVSDLCTFLGVPKRLTIDAINRAAQNYFIEI